MIEGKHNICCGCGGCEQICPMNCIEMYPDEMGFLYPHVDMEKCIACGMCDEVCPSDKNKEKMQLSCVSYKCRNKADEILKKSSSGGVFYSLAQYVLHKNGVVFGAAYDEQQNVCHTFVENIDELDTLCRSKYVQSRIGEVYKQVVEFLKQKREVLFVGMPCQVAGCKEYLRVLIQQGEVSDTIMDYLLLVDLLCGSVTSPYVYKSYLAELEKKYKSNVVKINHREKDGFKWSEYGVSVRFGNGTVLKEIQKENYYMMGYVSKLYSRESCFECNYKRMNSQSDITIGDMILSEKIRYTSEEEKGYSLLILKSEKGKRYFKAINREFVYENLGMEHMAQKDRLWKQHIKHPNADVFKNEFIQKQYSSLEELVWKNLNLAGRAGMEELNYRFGLWGGWNTRAVLRKLVDDKYNNKIIYHICKSSLISLYSNITEKLGEYISNQGNTYRYQMVCRDIDKSFRMSIKKQLQSTDVLLVDFVEEQYELLYMEEQSIITDSDALRECAEESLFEKCLKIELSEENRMKMWQEACNKWIQDILEVMEPKRIIVLKLYLADKKGHNGNIVESYVESNRIKLMNERLTFCYDYFIKNCPEVHVIELKNKELQYTDIMHKYGCVPEHLNDEAYDYLADNLYNCLIKSDCSIS